MEDKVEHVAEHVEDLMDNYHPDYNIKFPDDFPSKSLKVKFEASQLELQKTGDIYSEVLHKMAKQRLDRNMAIIKGERLQLLVADTPLGMENPYKLLNKSFWVRTVSATGLHKQILAHNKFL